MHERNNDTSFFLSLCVCVPVVSVHWLFQCTTTGARESIVRFRLLLLLLHFVGKRIRECYTVASLTSWSNIYTKCVNSRRNQAWETTGESHRRATSCCDVIHERQYLDNVIWFITSDTPAWWCFFFLRVNQIKITISNYMTKYFTLATQLLPSRAVSFLTPKSRTTIVVMDYTQFVCL